MSKQLHSYDSNYGAALVIWPHRVASAHYVKHLTDAEISAERESVSDNEGSPEKQVLKLMLAIRSAVAARAAQLSDELARVHDLLSLVCDVEKSVCLGSVPIQSNDLPESIRAQLTSSFALSIEEFERLHVLGKPPGHSRPLWHPSRWLASLYRLALGRQYAFNQWMTEHHARLAQQTETLRICLLQMVTLTAREAYSFLTFERHGFDLLREVFDGVQSILSIVWRMSEDNPHAATIWGHGGSGSWHMELAEWKAEFRRFRDRLDALAQQLGLLEEKTRRLEALSATTATLSRQLDSFASDYEAALQEIRDDIRAFQQQANQLCDPVQEEFGTNLKAFVRNRVPHPPRPLTPAFSFLEFERALRGGEYQIAQEQSRYVDWFISQPAPILDVGCGRGEFLELLRQHGIEAMGIDRDADMVSYCQQKGLKVLQAELEEYLKSLPDESLGGVFLGQVIEHLEQRLVLELPMLLWSKLVHGGTVVIETVNPMCLSTFAGAMYADPTHVRPIHPKGLEFLLASVGFTEMTLLFSAPVPEGDKLQLIQEKTPLDPTAKDLVIQMNENFQRLNTLLYSYANYAVAARKPR